MSDKLEGMKEQYHSVMREGQALAFIKIIHANHDATLAEVAAFADGCGLENLTVGQCFFGKLPKTGEGWVKRLAPRAQKALGPGQKTRARRTKKKRNLRMQADRDAYDAYVFEHIRRAKDWISAAEIRTACGGEPHQARAALNRLIEAGKVQYKGRAAGVRYKAA